LVFHFLFGATQKVEMYWTQTLEEVPSQEEVGVVLGKK
jgi:hypothetical protein